MKSLPLKINFFFTAVFSFFLYHCAGESSGQGSLLSLEQDFISPPSEARPAVMWWWLNSFISENGITRDLEEMEKQGIGGALIFDAAPVDRWKPKDVEPAPVGPPFMSDRWRELFRHAIREADRLNLELGVSLTSGFNAGGPWVTPAYGQQEIVWAEKIVEAASSVPIHLPLPSGPVYDDQGELLSYSEMQVNNDLERDDLGNPLHYEDIAVLAFPLQTEIPQTAGKKPTKKTTGGRLKNWALKSVHSFSYPEKAGFLFDSVYETDEDRPGDIKVKLDSITDLSDLLDKDGVLDWQVPPGKWMIIRFGYTHTGIRLQATNPQNEGLAMNHLSTQAATRHFDEIGRKMIDDIAAVGGNNPVYFYLDSWEVRIANWTDDFREQFQERRGYDMTPYLPVLAGIIVSDREISNRFLHDYRMTIGDCIADNYYRAFRDLSHQNGFQFRAEMATTPIPVDMLKCLGRVDLPFGEFWTETDLPGGRVEPWQRMFGKQAASAAHIYGSRFAAAEALTVIQKHWEHSPFHLKKTVDQAFCSGLNRLMIHTFTHSPPETRPPGYEYFAGTHFNPQITWWDQAHVFTEYISRCQYLLQQGHFIADVCFYQGDQIPAFVPMKQIQPGLGYGYDYDIVNSEVILTRMSVENRLIKLPDGMHYRLLVLPDTDKINPAVLKKIMYLVSEGATVIGRRPQKAYGLEDFPKNDSLVRILADQLWGDCDGLIVKERKFGAGRIICGKTANQVLNAEGIFADFAYRHQRSGTEIDFFHRRTTEDLNPVDIYFVINSKNRWENIDCSFRVDDRRPELWDPASGEIKRQDIYTIEENRTTMPINLAPFGSVFIVFRQPPASLFVTGIFRNGTAVFPADRYPAENTPLVDISFQDKSQLLVEAWESGEYLFSFNDGREAKSHFPDIADPLIITGPWKIRFPAGWGAPDSVLFSNLISWTQSEIDGIKFFSGTATYHTEFTIDEKYLKQERQYYLDLGVVKDLAEIRLNDQIFPILWKYPFRIDISPWLRSGINKLEIEITNLWPNRLIGDQWLPKDKRFTYTNIGKFTKDTPLFESGLLGPVRIYTTHQRLFDF